MLKIETARISDLKPHPKNPRVHPEAALDRLVTSIKEFGWTNPVLVSNDGFVLAGHARLKAAQKAGLTEVPIIRLDLSGAKADAYLVADNRLQEMTDWDLPVLKDLLQGLDTGEFDVEITGFDQQEIEDLINPEVKKTNKYDQQGYYAAEDEINWIKLAHRLQLCAVLPRREKALELFAGQGRLSWWYHSIFRDVVTVDKVGYSGVQHVMKASQYIEKISDEFDLIDIDDEGYPSFELVQLFNKIKSWKNDFGLAITDGNGLKIKRSNGKIDWNKFYGVETGTFYNWDSIFQGFIERLVKNHGWKSKQVSFYRKPWGNVIYACYLISRHLPPNAKPVRKRKIM